MELFAAGIGVLIVGGVLAVAAGSRRTWASAVGGASAVTGSLLALANAIAVLSEGRAASFAVPWHVPFGRLSLGLDPLSAVFVLPIGLVVAVAAVYGTQYLDGPHGPHRVGPSWLGFNTLAAAMLMVVAARNGLLFLMAWEAMSLASFFLVMSEHQHESVRRAGWTYLVAAHLGTSCLLVLFLLLGQRSGSLDFDQYAAEPALAGVLFVLAVVGFGTKAGFMPVHVWLPEAHPAAPSHVSAVMSGVMIKMGIYGLVRVLTFLGEPSAWWGWTLVGIGVSSGVLGVLFAVAQHDLKRLLAYSSVENVGIITLGLGVGLLGVCYRLPAMAALGYLGALLHVLNHALFKSLLFLGAGAIQQATGTRDLHRLGGLLKRMPVTGGTFLLGACAICGLPPLNGLMGELLIYVATLSGVADAGRAGDVEWALLCVLVLGGLALIGGLAVVAFTKAFGSVFLGMPRSEDAERGREVGARMRGGMLVLAGGCVLAALAAPVWPFVLGPAVAVLTPAWAQQPVAAAVRQAAVPLAVACASCWAVWGVAGLLAWFRRRLLAGRAVTAGPTWDCGYAAPHSRMQYSASSYVDPLLALFRMVLRPRIRLQPPAGLFPAEAGYRSEVSDVFRDHVLRPAFLAVMWGSAKLRWMQQGRIQLYVLYIAVTVLSLLIWKLG